MGLVARLGSAVIVLIAVVLLLREGTSPPATPEGVLDAFKTYREAVLNGDGNAAAGVLSDATIGWYDRAKKLALYGSKDTIEKLPPMEKFQTLAFRHRVDAGKLQSMSARELVAYSVAQGWMSKAALEKAEAHDVHIEGNSAKADISIDGKSQQFDFVREHGHWRFDQLPLLSGADTEFRAAAAQRQMTEDQLILALLEAASKKKVGDEIWNPPGEAAK